MLYTTYIRPHVEFAAAAWSPYEKRDIKLLERVQRKATKIPTATAQLDYEDRCAALGLTSLETRRTRGDLLTRFKIDRGLEVVNWHSRLPTSSHLGHERHQRELVKTNQQRHNFLTNRTANAWNKLHVAASKARSTNAFKALLDKMNSQHCVSRTQVAMATQ